MTWQLVGNIAGKDADPSLVDSLRAKVSDLENEVALLKSAAPLHGAPGRDGKDGTGIVSTLIDQDGYLILTLSDGRTEKAGVVVGKDVDPAHVEHVIREEVAKFPIPQDGKPGTDGKDGIPWDSAELVLDEERGHVLKAVQGDQVKEWRLVSPWDAGVFRDGKKYLKGAGVTHGGSWWIAQEDTWDKPGQSKAWRLAVKAGRDRDRT